MTTVTMQREDVQAALDAMAPMRGMIIFDQASDKLRAALEQQPDDFAARGTLASLKCWHRLSDEEADELVKMFAAPKELTDEEILALGKSMATAYAHRSDPTYFSYAFVRTTLIDFARAVLARDAKALEGVE